MANVVIDIAAEYTGNKAFKQAETATQKLEKSVAKLGKQFAGVFAASKLYSFGKSAAKAFAADDKAARSLALALANTGNAFADIQVEKFIADLQRTTGVLDDELRPAFRTLLTATGDVKKSQDGLALALDISAGTGKDLGAVTMALAKAYGGQTTALSRLGAGLDKATLKTGDMAVITQTLTDKFKGQALAAAEGYSGSIARLTVASQNAKEIIGKDLLDSIQMLSGKEGIGNAITQIESLATSIGNVIYGVSTLITKLKSIPGLSIALEALGTSVKYSPLALLERYGASAKSANAGNPAQSPGQRKAIDKANADAIKLQKQQNSLKTIDNALTTRKITLTADQQALEELKKKFDVERIGLYAALNNATDEETRLRLRSLIAIHDNDAALAGKIKSEEEAAKAAALLAESLKASLAAWAAWQSMIGASFAAAASATPTQYFGTDTSQPYSISNIPQYMGAPGDIPGITGQRGFNFSGGAPSVVVNVAGSVTAERDLVSAITQGIYNNQASGIPINYSTSYV